MKKKQKIFNAMRASQVSSFAKCEDGFSLIELLVALAVFSIAALALLESQAGSVRASTLVQLRTLASIVAENQTAEFIGSEIMPQVGQFTGQENQLEGAFHWTTQRSLVPGAGIMRQTVIVTDMAGAELATLTAFRLVN